MYWGRREAKFPTDERIKQMVSFNLFNLLGNLFNLLGIYGESVGN